MNPAILKNENFVHHLEWAVDFVQMSSLGARASLSGHQQLVVHIHNDS